MAIAGGGSGGVKAYEKAVRRATPSYNPPVNTKPFGGPQSLILKLQ